MPTLVHERDLGLPPMYDIGWLLDHDQQIDRRVHPELHWHFMDHDFDGEYILIIFCQSSPCRLTKTQTRSAETKENRLVYSFPPTAKSPNATGFGNCSIPMILTWRNAEPP